jgi:hypothetical protein
MFIYTTSSGACFVFISKVSLPIAVTGYIVALIQVSSFDRRTGSLIAGYHFTAQSRASRPFEDLQ